MSRPHSHPKIHEFLTRLADRKASYDSKVAAPVLLGLMSEDEKQSALLKFAADKINDYANSFYNDDGLRIFIPNGKGRRDNVDYLLTTREGTLQVEAYGRQCVKAGGTEKRRGQQHIRAARAARQRLK